MAVHQGSDSELMASAIPEQTCVVVGLEFGGCSRDELDDWAIAVQQALDAYAAVAAPGAAVSCRYEPLTVDVLFTVEKETAAQVHQRIAEVFAAVQKVVPVQFNTETATRSGDSRELIPA
ncbi:MAG TPA: hypothetical protein VGG08_08210 [Solirubrobacteraceae bacterium]|jgi:hypothetical protein